MLLNPGAPFEYNGRRLAYPDIRLVYWAGGNPFHHHQDIARLQDAFARPDTIVVHDSAWTETAPSAYIGPPAKISVDRRYLGPAGRGARTGGLKTGRSQGRPGSAHTATHPSTRT